MKGIMGRSSKAVVMHFAFLFSEAVRAWASPLKEWRLQFANTHI